MFRHLYFNELFNLEEVYDDADYAVFDDLIGDFEFFKHYKGWLGSQHEFTLTDKYKKKHKFIWGKPSIMCMNNDPLTSPHIDLDWILGNCFIVKIEDPIVDIHSDQ